MDQNRRSLSLVQLCDIITCLSIFYYSIISLSIYFVVFVELYFIFVVCSYEKQMV